MSLIQRIIGGFFILLVGMLILVVVSYFSINRIQDDLNHMTGSVLPIAQSAGDGKTNILQQYENVMSIFSTDVPEKVDEIEK